MPSKSHKRKAVKAVLTQWQASITVGSKTAKLQQIGGGWCLTTVDVLCQC